MPTFQMFCKVISASQIVQRRTLGDNTEKFKGAAKKSLVPLSS